jgi:hypothetical protein
LPRPLAAAKSIGPKLGTPGTDRTFRRRWPQKNGYQRSGRNYDGLGGFTLASNTRTIRFAALALLCASALPAETVQVFSRAALGGNDFIDWGQLGPFVPQPVIPPLPNNPVSVASNNGMPVSASAPSTGFLFLDQQAPSTATCQCWNGNFAPNDYLFGANTAAPELLTLTFSAPVYGIGTQMGVDAPPGPFIEMMQLFDPLGNSLGSFLMAGNEADTADNSAAFIGALSTTPIGSVTFSTSDSASASFAINDVDLLTSAPEPSTLTFLGVGLTGLVALRRRKAA